jgi:hypothetical protein
MVEPYLHSPVYLRGIVLNIAQGQLYQYLYISRVAFYPTLIGPLVIISYACNFVFISAYRQRRKCTKFVMYNFSSSSCLDLGIVPPFHQEMKNNLLRCSQSYTLQNLGFGMKQTLLHFHKELVKFLT